jgi:uncharacterized membrane protein YkvA (DUF1232 family)
LDLPTLSRLLPVDLTVQKNQIKHSDNKTLIKNRLPIREAKCFHLIPMRKAKSSDERHASYQKPALRSEAFARALSEAKLCVAGSGGLRSLFEQAAKKAASLPKQPFKENWAYLQTMLRLIRAYERGEYRQISNDALIWIVAGLNYLIDPFDLIPDKTPFLGFVDDATVIEFVAAKTQQTLDNFMTWETTATVRGGDSG